MLSSVIFLLRLCYNLCMLKKIFVITLTFFTLILGPHFANAQKECEFPLEKVDGKCVHPCGEEKNMVYQVIGVGDGSCISMGDCDTLMFDLDTDNRTCVSARAEDNSSKSKEVVDTKSENKSGIVDTGQTNSYDGSSQPITLINPLGDDDLTLPGLIERILSIALRIGTPLVALAIIYTGYLFIAAQGNPDKLKKAKDTLMYVLIGAAILLGAYAIAKALVSTINAIRG